MCVIRCFVRASVPRAFHVVVGKFAGERDQRVAIDLGTKCSSVVVPGDTVFEMSYALKRGIPSSLQLARHQPLCRIHDLIAASGQCRFVACFLEFPAQCLSDIGIGLLGLIGGLQSGLNRVLRHSLDNLSCDRAIDPDTSNAVRRPSGPPAPPATDPHRLQTVCSAV